jgi:hypothetical protein
MPRRALGANLMELRNMLNRVLSLFLVVMSKLGSLVRFNAS